MADSVGLNPELLGPQARAGGARLRQNWVLDPFQDAAFVILAPLAVLALAVVAFRLLGTAAATALILGTHIVMTVAHHLPTFIRIYGDMALFARHRWTFLLAPVLPFAISLSAGAYLIVHELPIENLLYLFLLAVLWDPWHFLMQHYGFMRIYDRHNQAPRRLAARMDLALCAICFVAIMLASGDWLAGLLEDLYRSAGLPLVLALPLELLPLLQQLAQFLAIPALAAYAVYLLWCRRQGHFISVAKLALFAASFGVMALAYTPNAWIAQLAPGWSFKVGFAAVGIVHMTQYLAIVWRYNRGLAGRNVGVRKGWFQRLHARGGWWVGGAYVLACLFYGQSLTSEWDSRWLMALLISVGLTSTLTHYYFDGFIWKLRQTANREHLALPDPHREPAERARENDTPRLVLLRQTLYFGLPLAVLTAGAVAVWDGSHASYVGHMLRAHVLSQEGDVEAARKEALEAYAAMDRQLPIERRMIALQATASRETSLALLIYNHSRFEHLVLPALEGRPTSAESRREHLEQVASAATLLERALSRGPPLTSTPQQRMSAQDAQRLLQSWQAELASAGVTH